MRAKHGLDIAMVVPGMPFDGNTLERGALGGSETAALYMAKGLAKAGASVIVFCNTQEAMADKHNVRYLPLQAWDQYARGTMHDVSIIQRAPELLATQPHNSRLNVMWMHDLALVRTADQFRAVQWNVDFSFVVSEFMKKQYMDVYGLEESALRVTRNGIDVSHLTQARAAYRNSDRDRFHLVYAARPERGLDMLLNRIMPELIKRDPRFHLTVCGYPNTVEKWAPFYNDLRRAMARLGTAHANDAGALTKDQLYALMASAGAYVYPTPSPELKSFYEVSCIAAMEAQGAGLPIVASRRGALPETIAHQESLIDGDPMDDEYVRRFCDAVEKLANDDEAFNDAQSAGIARANKLDWDSEAKRWLDLFEAEIAQRNDDPDRMIRDMWRNSDIIAAKHWLEQEPDAFEHRHDLERLLEPFAFMDEKDGYRKQYERIGETHDDWVYDTAPREPRFHLLRDWLAENKRNITRVLDYGCAHGAYAIGLAQQLPHLQITGADIDHFSVEMAEEWAKKRGVEDRAQFRVWTHDMDAGEGEQYDAALLQEVLEHVPEPWEVISKVESRVKVGGKVYITVPFGPWEYSSYHNYPWRCHIWHFDKHDILDMIGQKRSLVIDSYYAGDNPQIGVPQGWWIISYDADHKPIGEVDLERKRWLARPRHTVSGNIIAGGNSAIETMLWSLRSIYHLCDEIVIADCGMSAGQLATALNILHDAEPIARWKQKVRVVDGIDPKKQGFETARNIALDASRMDFVFWIDLDERLMRPVNIQKYLRDNMYSGYGIRQMHLSCDFQMNPDMPVRLFRRRARSDGKSLRFFGAIHEHPEFELNEGPGQVIVLSDCSLAHIGYLSEEIRQDRFVRNWPLLQLDQERYPERRLQKFFLMRDKVQLARFELRKNGNVPTPEIKALMREVVELGRKYFIGSGSYMNSDAIQYYSEALEILGEGFSASFAIDVDKSESKPNGATTYRFANKEDFMLEFNKRASTKIDPMEREFF